MKRLALMALVLLGAPAAARDMTPAQVRALPTIPPVAVDRYGTAAQQFGELRLPPGPRPRRPLPVVVVVHGGCWNKAIGETVRGTAPIASALAGQGLATWNVEYRQVGDAGGGWPGTFQDWATATDHLRELAKSYPLDLKRVVVVGHSAGAHAALWIAARAKLPASSIIRGAKPLPIRAAVAIDGPGDLAPFVGRDAQVCGMPVIAPLMGGTPDAVPDRYREGSPAANLPLGVQQTMVASTVLTPADAEAYRAAAAAKGDTVTVVTTPGSDHFNIIAPGEPQWADVQAAILKAIPPK